VLLVPDGVIERVWGEPRGRTWQGQHSKRYWHLMETHEGGVRPLQGACGHQTDAQPQHGQKTCNTNQASVRMLVQWPTLSLPCEIERDAGVLVHVLQFHYSNEKDNIFLMATWSVPATG
jgi:hypothetical protein